MEYQLQYIEEANVTEEDYLQFLKSQYHERAHIKHGIRRNWYKNKTGYRILLTIRNGKILGQSCAFRDIAVVFGKEIELWWGVDVFVLPEERGKGIGKLMQKKYHEDLPNFCSAWYSPTNGIIKRKCGSKELFPLSFCYYPISSFFSYIGTLVLKKIFKRDISFRLPLSFMYSSLNYIRKNKEYSIREVKLNKDIFDFVKTSSLQESDFYVKRDESYLKWRYIENPNLKYQIIEISRNKQVESYAIFTDVYYDGKFYVSKIMDVFKKQSSPLKEKDILCFVSKHFQNKRIDIDGLLHLTKCDYFPRFIRNAMFLSTMDLNKEIKHPYISYSDQDMVQMY